MKKMLGLIGCLFLVVAFAGVGFSGSDMGSKKGNLSGEIVKMSGEMVDVKDRQGKIHAVHIDPVTTQKSGELKVGGMVGADVTPNGHAESIWVIE